jgi:hypothetical protein
VDLRVEREGEGEDMAWGSQGGEEEEEEEEEE